MKKEFLKKADLQLINGGYLSNKEGNPVYNKEFVEAQTYAHFIVTFVTEAKGHDFIGKEAEDITAFRKNIISKLNTDADVTFIEEPKAPKTSTMNKLYTEAMSFMKFQDKTEETKELNKFLQQFKIINEFEEFGLFFDQDIVKLNKIYTMEEIINAVKEGINLLNK